jgi:hypothetical protein
MNTRYVLNLLAAVALAVGGGGCAPVDVPLPMEPPAEPPSPKPEEFRNPPSSTADARDTLKARLDAAIRQARERDLLTTHGFWTVFHGILGLGPSVTLLNPETGQRVNALDYLAAGGALRGLRFVPTPDGVDVEVRPGTFISQGHQDQFVAEMVQWGVAPERPFVVEGNPYTFRDFIRHSKARASAKAPQELEWAILIIGQHFGTDAAWTNAAGEEVRFEELVRKELDKPLTEAACGGTHRLFGLTWVYHLHLGRAGKTEGVWKDVSDRLAEAKQLARRLQNPDGTFSTEFFRGPGHAADLSLRLNTTGHIFEWLTLALTDDELNEPWIQDAVNALALMFLEIQDRPIEAGTFYHALHGLLIYYSRVFGTEPLGDQAPHVPLPPPGGKDHRR